MNKVCLFTSIIVVNDDNHCLYKSAKIFCSLDRKESYGEINLQKHYVLI